MCRRLEEAFEELWGGGIVPGVQNQLFTRIPAGRIIVLPYLCYYIAFMMGK